MANCMVLCSSCMYSIHIEVGYLFMDCMNGTLQRQIPADMFMRCMNGTSQRQIPADILMLLANEYPITFKVFQIFCND